MFRRLCVWVLVASPGLAFGASKEIQELQRDVAQLQDMVRTLQRNQDEKFAALQAMVQQSITSANEAVKSVAIIQSGFQQSVRDQQREVVTPVVSLGARMDQMSSDLRTVSQAVTDLTSLISKIQGQLTDLGNAVKVMQAPAAPPPTTTSGSAPPPSGDSPTISSQDLYQNATRDRMGGKLDLALQEYADYLRWYGNTDLAPNAQYYIASIHSSLGDYDSAVREFDIVLEKYPDNPKTADSMYEKGLALMKMSRRTDGGREFQELIKRFPKNPLAPKACDQLKSLGYGCGPSRAAASKSAPKRKKQ